MRTSDKLGLGEEASFLGWGGYLSSRGVEGQIRVGWGRGMFWGALVPGRGCTRVHVASDLFSAEYRGCSASWRGEIRAGDTKKPFRGAPCCL